MRYCQRYKWSAQPLPIAEARDFFKLGKVLYLQSEIPRDFAKSHPILMVVVEQHVHEWFAEVADGLLRHVALHLGRCGLLLLPLLARHEFRNILRALLPIEFLRRSFFPSRRRHTRSDRDWSSDVCSSD